MKYRIICVGKVKEEFYRKMIDEYSKIINKCNSIQIIELEDEKTPENASELECLQIIRTEGDRIRKYLTKENRDLVVALCIEGKQYSTEEWNSRLQRLVQEQEYEQITYIIGGSLGLADEVVKCADIKLSFSRLTFPHQLMRVMLLEQISIASIE